MQDHLRYRQRFNEESVRFILYFILIAGSVLFLIRVGEAVSAADPIVVAPISVVLLFSVAAWFLFRAGQLDKTMTVLLVGSSLTMVAASYVFSFTASMPFWLVQAALLVTAGGVYSTRQLAIAVGATLIWVVLAFALQKAGLNMGRAYGPQVSDWLALVATVMLLGLSGTQSLRFARMFEQTIADLARSSDRLSGLLTDQEQTNRQLQDSEDRYRLLLENTPVAIVRYDAALAVDFNNPQLLRMFGLTPDSASRLTLDRLASLPLLRVLQAALDGQAGHYEGAHVNASNGRPWWLAASCTPVYDDNGKVVGAVASISDESDRRRRDLELSRTRDLADRASQARNRFLSLMSHEIRTPMNDVYGYAQILMDPRLTDERRIQLKGNILKASRALISLVDEIIDASKMEAGLLKLEEKRFEPAILMREAVEQFNDMAKGKNLHLYCGWQGDDPGYLMGDAARLRQMLGNLLTNAIQFTPSGFVQVVGEELSRDDERCALKFSVTDSGLGIPRERQAHLFESPDLVDDGTGMDPVGSGLGLAIVRRLANLMGGDVGVMSEPANGSTFWFIVNLRLDERDPWDDGSDDEEADDEVTAFGSAVAVDTEQAGFRREPSGFAVSGDAVNVPVSAPAPVVSKPVRRLAQHSGKNAMNILLVEDNPTNAQLVQDMLELEGFTVHHAGNGQEAIDMLYGRQLQVDVVLMDCRMPIMDGYECTQRIRAHEADHPDEGHLPIIALTANVFEDDRNRCIQVGMDDFLRKPVDLSELVKAIQKHGS